MAITKIDSSMLEDVSGADNLVKLDANAKIPAISGANLLIKPGPLTSASDPTVSSNKTLGTEWLNSASGEMYVCTDATTGANVWTIVGGGTGDVEPFYIFGTQYGYTAGGNAPTPAGNRNVIDKYSFTSQSNATDVGNLTTNSGAQTPNRSKTHGYVSGGAGLEANINKFSFAADGDAVDAGFDLSASRHFAAGASTSTHGYTMGGVNGSTWAMANVIDKFSFAASATAVDIGDVVLLRERLTSHSSQTHGYGASGHVSGGGLSNAIEKFSFAAGGNSTDVGDLTEARGADNGGGSSATYGYAAGGYNPGSSNVIDKFSFSSDGNATDVGDLPNAIRHGMVSSATDYGYHAGGYPASNMIQRWSFTSDGNAVDWADLTVTKLQGTSNQF